MNPTTCVAPGGHFVYGIHKPCYQVDNLRETDAPCSLGSTDQNKPIENKTNFPAGGVEVPEGEQVYEVANPFPFRGSTFILKSWADESARNPGRIGIPQPPAVSLSQCLQQWMTPTPVGKGRIDRFLQLLPEPIQLALAVTSTDAAELVRLAELTCEFEHDAKTGTPTGIKYRQDHNADPEPVINNHKVFEALANNYHLPDAYKKMMVLIPGAQGKSEIVGDWTNEQSGTRVYEYLRRNSYIPWGHYAANMADSSVRYRIEDLTLPDITGMRHLYYQRTLVRLAAELGLDGPEPRRRLTEPMLETIRRRVLTSLQRSGEKDRLSFVSTLWGWNFGYDYAPSHYRLHASHQQAHQQYALIPHKIATFENGTPREQTMSGYGCGEQVRTFIDEYRHKTGVSFFEAYEKAIRGNQRLDGKDRLGRRLVVYDDERVMLFVPKAQTSQWELQLMPRGPIGNVLEADSVLRGSLDRAIWIAVRVLGALGASMITSIEYPKRFVDGPADQRLLYSFLPRLPESPGAFSEAQARWINGHYPEDFASVCRQRLPDILNQLD